MINRVAHWTVSALIAAGLTMAMASAAAAQQEDISPAGKPAEGQPAEKPAVTPAEKPAEKPAATDEKPAEGGGEGREQGQGDKEDEQAPPPSSPFRQLLPLLLVGVILMWILAGRKSRKADKQRRNMLSDLKKGDKVTSIGGIVGTATDVREHDVTVKVDETSNTRLKLARWAIRSVGTPAEDAETEKK